MKLNKKLLIFLLSLVMLVSTLTVAAFAADGAAAANDDLAFTYQVDGGEVQSVASTGDAMQDGINFYTHLNDKSNVKIVMYSDIILNQGVLFGTLKEPNEDGKVFVDTSGNVDWDLNGHTVTVAEAVEPLTVQMGKDDGYRAFEALHHLGKYSFKLYSSVPGGKYINNSSYAVFGQSKYSATSFILGTNDLSSNSGENFTMISKGAFIRGYESNGDSPLGVYLGINGGTYIYSGEEGVVCIGGTNKIQNATFITTGAAKAVFLNHWYKKADLFLNNVTVVAQNDATLLAASGSPNAPTTSSVNETHNVTLSGAVLLGKGLNPAYNVASDKVTYTVSGNILASDEDILSVAYPTPPTGVAKTNFDIEIRQADGTLKTVTVFGYITDDQIYTVTYGNSGVTKRYLVGLNFVPLAMKSEYYTVTVDVTKGTANIPVAWANVPADGAVLDASYGGQTVTVAPQDNPVTLAFVLYDETAGKHAYALADSDSIGAELVAALSAQANAATLYVYSDITAPALTFAKDTIVELADATLTMGGAITVSEGATLSVKGGEVLSAEATPFVLNGKLLLSAEAKIYLSNATVVFGGAGTVTCENVDIYNLASASMAADAVSVTLSDAKIKGVALGANVTVGGTVLGTDGTFAGNAYADGVISGLIVNNNTETVTVLGQTYTVAYAEAATDVDAMVISVTYMYQNAVRGTQKYYYGSIANFHKELTEGYYFEYVGEVALTESATIECTFHADASKLKAQVILTDALNYIYYLRVESAGVLQNLTLNGKTLDLAALEQTLIDEKSYYVIPVTFESFADALGNCELSVDLVSGGEILTVTASAALHDYLGTLLATSEEAVAKQAYAVAGYVSALVSHFDYNFTFGDVRMKNLGRINNLLADYAEYKVEAALPTESEISSAYVKSVVLVADEKVTFAFRVENDFDGSIEIDGVAAALSKPFEGFDRLYATTTVSLADLGEEITLTVKDAEGAVLETLTYSLEDYVCGVTAQNEGTAAAYAKALWNLASVLG